MHKKRGSSFRTMTWIRYPEAGAAAAAAAELALFAIQNGAREVILAHLSAENNTPAHALRVVGDRLRGAGVELDREVRLSVAPRSEMGRTCFLGEEKEVVHL